MGFYKCYFSLDFKYTKDKAINVILYRNQTGSIYKLGISSKRRLKYIPGYEDQYGIEWIRNFVLLKTK